MGFFDTPTSACFIEDLLDFKIDEADTVDTALKNPKPLSSQDALFPSPEFEEEEELEWLSNKDVFPSVDTFVQSVETFSEMTPFDASTTALKQESPVSVLENCNSGIGSNSSNIRSAIITRCCSGRGLAPPIRRPRSRKSQWQQRGGFANIPSEQWFELCRSTRAEETSNNSVKASSGVIGFTGRKCTHCGSEKTPQWRAGPEGPKTLCNACGVRYKSGRLCPEYRPANSPTFSSALHSNSHRKVVEMRKMKQTSNVSINLVDNG